MPVTANAAKRLSPRQPVFGTRYLDKLKGLLSIDFDDHDGWLKDCLEAARADAEDRTGLLLTEGTVTVSWAELYDWEDLPYGPVFGTVTASNLDGTTIIAQVSDEDFPQLVGNYPAGIKLSYTAGYTRETLPADLLAATLKMAANIFDGGDREWRDTIFKYRRGSFIQ